VIVLHSAVLENSLKVVEVAHSIFWRLCIMAQFFLARKTKSNNGKDGNIWVFEICGWLTQ